LTNTILLSEREIATAPYVQNGTVSAANQFNQKRAAVLLPLIYENPRACYALTDGVNYLANQTVQGNGGKFWHDGNPYYVRITTVLPPNAPSCFDRLHWGDGAPAIIPPTSEHTGGVNICLADGSVNFLTENVNAGNPSIGYFAPDDRNRSGRSPWGVWGGYGSKAGGENVTLPF
jgi:prepilin-type processing-associated H-X9-DG protein